MKGRKLIFISMINRDGKGVTKVDKEYRRFLQNEDFEMSCLSLTKETWIASSFNSFVVKIKNKYKK